jgi:transcriptional regulator GlxA family with amidase domain
VGRLPDHKVVFVAEKAGPVLASQGVEAVATYSFDDAPQFDILMVPGGGGTRQEVYNETLLSFLRKQDQGTEMTTSVCTGAALLAKAGLLDGKRATTNKLAYKWATSQSDEVDWIGHARWVTDGKYITSSGVSAGTDMALAIVETLYGREAAERRARGAEYIWNDDPGNDPFAVEIATSE